MRRVYGELFVFHRVIGKVVKEREDMLVSGLRVDLLYVLIGFVGHRYSGFYGLSVFCSELVIWHAQFCGLLVGNDHPTFDVYFL
jgi:hypothetical protein